LGLSTKKILNLLIYNPAPLCKLSVSKGEDEFVLEELGKNDVEFPSDVLVEFVALELAANNEELMKLLLEMPLFFVPFLGFFSPAFFGFVAEFVVF
jgi:hypothetical protein